MLREMGESIRIGSSRMAGRTVRAGPQAVKPSRLFAKAGVKRTERKETMQTDNRVLDEIAKLMMTAAGAAQGAAREAESLVRSRLERLLADLDLVGREEFDAMKALAQAARSETEALSRRVAVLEAALAERRGPVG